MTTTTTTSKAKRRLTNTNTDTLCLDDQNKGWFRKSLYRYDLWTGLYMLNSNEKMVFHLFGWILLCSLFLYIGMFFKGFYDGLVQFQEETAGQQQPWTL